MGGDNNSTGIFRVWQKKRGWWPLLLLSVASVLFLGGVWGRALTSWANTHSGFLTLIFTAVVAIATVFYVILTGQLVKESRLVRQAQHDPHISMHIAINEGIFNLVDLIVKNDGGGPAYDIRFEVIEDMHRQDKPVLGERPFIQRGWHYLGAGHERRTMLINMIGSFEDGVETTAQVRVKWKDAIGRLFSENIFLELREFEGFRGAGHGDMHKVALNIENIQRTLSSLANGYYKPFVRIQDVADYRREEEEWYAKAASDDNSGNDAGEEQ